MHIDDLILIQYVDDPSSLDEDKMEIEKHIKKCDLCKEALSRIEKINHILDYRISIQTLKSQHVLLEMTIIQFLNMVFLLNHIME